MTTTTTLDPFSALQTSVQLRAGIVAGNITPEEGIRELRLEQLRENGLAPRVIELPHTSNLEEYANLSSEDGTFHAGLEFTLEGLLREHYHPSDLQLHIDGVEETLSDIKKALIPQYVHVPFRLFHLKLLCPLDTCNELNRLKNGFRSSKFVVKR